jgi:hypothetical protein
MVYRPYDPEAPNDTDRGILIPRLTAAQRDAIDGPLLGLAIFNTDTQAVEVNTVDGWVPVASSGLSASDLTNGTTGSGDIVLAESPTIASPTFTGTVAGAGTIPNSVLVDNSITIAGHTIALGGSHTLAASDLTNGTTGSGEVVLATSPAFSETMLLPGTVGYITSNGIVMGGGSDVDVGTKVEIINNFSDNGSVGAPAAIFGRLNYSPTADNNNNPDGVYGDLWYNAPHSFTGEGAAIRGNAYTIPQIAATIVSGGSNNAVNDVLTVVGGTVGIYLNSVVQFTVSSVSAGGVVTGVQYVFGGAMATYPSNPVSTTSSNGSATPPTLDLTNTPLAVTNLIGVYGRGLHSAVGTVTNAVAPVC